jgi:hypothetical protein
MRFVVCDDRKPLSRSFLPSLEALMVYKNNNRVMWLLIVGQWLRWSSGYRAGHETSGSEIESLSAST